MDVISIQVPEESSGERLDAFLCRYDAQTSRSAYQKRIREGNVVVNRKTVKPNFRIAAGDIIELQPVQVLETDILPENIPLDILYEDEDVLVVNKPKGMVVHPAPGHSSGTLVNALMYHCKDSLSGINGELRPGIVHRIDKDTTGSLIVCKNDLAHVAIAEQIKAHSITRIYRGIVSGNVRDESGTINQPIGRDSKDRKKMSVRSSHGRTAVTHYRVLKRLEKNYTYMQFRLETGRTHQIRVHMADIGHPLLGDEVYGPPKCPFRLQGQTLHAEVLGFAHPRTGEYMEIRAPLPEYFEHLLEIL